MNDGYALPIPYPDELLYSVITRYHLRMSNVSPKWTFREIYGTHNVIPTIDLPSHLEAFSRKSALQGITADDWINRHTFYQYYAPFLPKDRAVRLRDLMKGPDGSGIHVLVGITASTVDGINGLRFCPSCYEQDIYNFGEPYWHRIHQLPGVMVCPSHRRALHEITAPLSERHGLTVLPISSDMFRSVSILEALPDKLSVRLSDIADDIQMLMQMDKVLALYDLRQVFLPRLREEGYVTAGEHIRQQKLEEQLVLFYGNEFLDLLESNPSSSDYSWLALSTRTPRWVIHPLRKLLLIRFLYGSFRAFHERSNDEGPAFGNGPWPCLNKAADHYRDFIVTQCTITRCSNTGRPVGTFKCSCGFSYSRRGPDQSEDDKFYRGRIKSFGSVWEDRLQRCIQEGLSYRSSAEILGVDTNTVIKYANGAMMHREIISVKKKTKQVRTSLRSSATKNKKNNRVDWEKRDLELSWMAEEACKEVLTDINSKPIRISIAMIGKRVGKLSWLEKHKHNLPITMSILSSYIESVSQFQMRRVRWAAERMAGEWPLKRWKLEKMSGLRSDYSQSVSDEIDRCIDQSKIQFNFTTSEVITSWLH